MTRYPCYSVTNADILPLTPRQAKFVFEYLEGPREVSYCATRAARAAGYAWPDKQGPRLLTFKHVAAAVDARFLELYPDTAKYR